MIFKTSNDTTMAYKIADETVDEMGLVTDYLNGKLGVKILTTNGTDIIGVVDQESKNRLQFPHYVGGRDDFCVINVTQFVDKRSTINKYNVVAQRDFQLRVAMGVLEAQWQKGEYSKWRVEYQEGGKMFIQFLARRLTTQFNLDPYETSLISVLLAMYWNNITGDDWHTKSRDEVTKFIIKLVNVPTSVIDDVWGKRLKYENINELAVSISEILESPKLRGFDAVTLIQLTSNASFGVDVDRIVSIGMEYPPFWIAVVYVSLSDKSFKNTFIARLARQPTNRMTEELSRTLKRGSNDEY